MLKITPKVFDPKYHITSFEQKTEEKKKYDDPLTKWPVRGMAYSNDLAVAIAPLAPKLGAILWYPAMLYFGADIYDKYKNDKTSYDPCKVRGTQQAIFQAIASIMLPAAAIIGGQKAASYFGSMDKTGISLQSREEILNFSINHMGKKKLDKAKDNISGYKKLFFENLENEMDTLKSEKSSLGVVKSSFRNICRSLFGKRQPDSMTLSEPERVKAFAESQINTMFNNRKKLMNTVVYKDNVLSFDASKQDKSLSAKWYKKFEKLVSKYAKDAVLNPYKEHHAAAEVLKQIENSKINKFRAIKSIGGFIALGLAVKPIDHFVEHTIIKKYIEPKLPLLLKPETAQVNAYKEKVLST